jgi:hypothetical protein
LGVGLQVPESGDVKAVVDGVAAAAALTEYLPAFEPCDDGFEAGSDPAVGAVVVVADDAASVVAPGCGDGRRGVVMVWMPR